jgi:hypothetical protein
MAIGIKNKALFAMPISPKQYEARAAALEELAAAVTDRAIRNGYLELAAELRRFAEPATPLSDQTDEQILRLAERIVGHTNSKL